MTRRLLALLLLVSTAVGVPAAGAFGKARAKTSAVTPPVIKAVTPLKIKIGEVLTLRGKHFLPGKATNTVIFLRKGARPVFLKSDRSTRSVLRVTLSDRLTPTLPLSAGRPTSARYQLRVLARRLSKGFTPLKTSPRISPKTNGGPGGAGGSIPLSCAQKPPTNDPAVDSDGDGLPDVTERSLRTDPCATDTDGDGVWDSYEYRSALDLNRGNANLSTPYPGKRPYPNPLDPSDANTDYDGDSLTLSEEYSMWADPRYGAHRVPMNYSDGKQTTAPSPAPNPADAGNPGAIYPNDPSLRFLDANHDGTVSAPEEAALDFNRDGTVSAAELDFQDFNGDGVLNDDERDVDADGLTNYDEFHGRATAAYWLAVYKDERPYPVGFGQPDALDPDSDGDGIGDGLDDQDYDSFSNLTELSRRAAQNFTQPNQSAYGQVNPFNPCLPARSNPFTDLNTNDLTNQVSPDCMRHPPAEGGPAPFDQSPKYPSYQIKD